MSLLLEHVEQRQPFFERGSVRFVVALLTLLCVGVCAVIVYQKIEDFFSHTEEEGVLRDTLLQSLYASEKVPPAVKGGSELDYGLQGSAAQAPDPSGYLLFTAVDSNSKTSQVHYLDVSQIAFEAHRLLPAYIPYSAFVEVADVLTPRVFFGDVLRTALSQIPDEAPYDSHAIQKFDMDEGSLVGYASITGKYVRTLEWSPQGGLLAYSRLSIEPISYVDLVPIQNWEVVISDLRRDVVIAELRGATQPQWSPDGSQIVMLKSDGLYSYHVADQVETKIVGVSDDAQVLATSMLALSPDGSRLIWTIGKTGMIIVYAVTSGDTLTLTEIGRIYGENKEYYWPQFSFDGMHYAVQTIDKASAGSSERTNASIEVRARDSREILRSYSIAGYDFNTFFLDTWVQKLPEETEFSQ